MDNSRTLPQRQATEAQIARAIRVTEKSGLVVYGVTTDGAKVTVQTQPPPSTQADTGKQLDRWFND